MNTRVLARALALAEAEWDLVGEAVSFPGAAEHGDTCNRLGLFSSDPDTWSVERRQHLRRDLWRRLRARRSSALAAGPPAPMRRAAGTGVEVTS